MLGSVSEFKQRNDSTAEDLSLDPTVRTDGNGSRDELLARVPYSLKASVSARAVAIGSNERLVVYYTRFSTNGQNELSTARQIEDCDKYRVLNDMTLVKNGIYSDEGRSGLYMIGREGLTALLERVGQGDVFAVIIGDPSRIARDMVDLGWLYRKLHRIGVELHTASCGKMDKGKITLFGFLSETQVETLVHNTRFARRAMVAKNLVPWGARTFGYANVGDVGGHLKVLESEKLIVRRIFKLAIAGVARARIAAILNADADLGRRKRAWTADAVSGVIGNLLYRGLILYGRFKWKKDPETLRYTKTAAPKDEWLISYASHLVIVTDEEWKAAQPSSRPVDDVSDGATVSGERRRRGQFLLSELVHCPTCGTHMVCLGGPAGAEARRFVCSSHVYNRGCENGRSWDMGWVEAATLGSLTKVLDDPTLYRPYLDSLAAEAGKVATDTMAKVERLRRQLSDVQRELDATFDKKTMKGFGSETIARIRARKEIEVDKTRDALERMGSPRAAIDVERRVEELGGLAAALHEITVPGAIDLTTEQGATLAGAIRALISRVVPRPDPGSHGVAVTLTLAEMAFYDAKAEGSGGPLRVVQGLYVPPTKEEQQLARGRAEVEAYLASGKCLLDDATWDAIEDLLPKDVAWRMDGERRGGRALVDAMLLALRLRRPIGDLPAEYGSRAPLRLTTRTLVRCGAWSGIVTALGRLAPHLIEGVDTGRFDYVKNVPAARIPGGAASRKRRGVIIDLLDRPEGATLAEVRAATGQASGAARTTVSRLKLLDLRVERIKRADGTKAWRIAASSDRGAGPMDKATGSGRRPAPRRPAATSSSNIHA